MTPTARAAAELDALMRTPRRPQVVFCDWHGVLSHSLYWRTITENPDHPAHSILRDELSRLFTTGNADGCDSMRGRLSTREILTRATEHHPHLDIDDLCAQLADDTPPCRSTRPSCMRWHEPATRRLSFSPPTTSPTSLPPSTPTPPRPDLQSTRLR
ncbi:hypothetical protein [Nocardia asiatica]|uniref:hypothetical protein n=1 Tax=Nocardia asiatica TaxID=209252 RepID=UPI002458AFE5|nr:hypothetical protein [Nocardia asiatica]